MPSLISAAGGNFLDKMPQEGFALLKCKSNVCYSRSRANDSRDDGVLPQKDICYLLRKQPDPSQDFPQTFTNTFNPPIVPDSIPEEPTGNEDAMTLQNVYDLCISLCKQVSVQAKEITLLKAKISKLKKKATPVIKHFKEYQKRISKEQRQQRKRLSKKKRVQQESVSKQGRKNAKGDGKAKENAQSEGRSKEMMNEDKENDEVSLSTEDEVSTAKEGVSTDFEKVSTDRPKLSTDDFKVSTDEQMESTDDQVDASEEIFKGTEDQGEGSEEKVESTTEQKESTEEQRVGTEEQSKEEIASQASQTSTLTPTSVIFGDDETIATLLINMSKAKATSKEKEKGVELKDVEEIERPRPTSTRSLLTLKPLPKIDPKDKGKKKIEEEDESESEDDDIPQAVKKFKQLENDEELARKVQEEWEAEEEKNKIAEEEAANEALIKNFDDVKARIEADRILAEKLQEQEREQFTIEERAKFLHDTIAAQRKFLAQQRSQAIRNKPPTKNQLRNQMMTYIKHVGNYKHADLKSKKFEDIQALYEKIKRFNEDFISTRSAQDERFIKRMNEKGAGLSKSEVIKEETKQEVKIEDKEEESTRKRKLGTRKKMKSRKRRYIQNTSEDNNEKEDDELKLYLSIVQDEDKEVDYEILDRKYPIIDWKTVCLGTKPQFDESKEEEINLNVVTRSNGQQRYFSILTTVLSIFDREDLNAMNKMSFGAHNMNGREEVSFKKEIVVQMLNLKLESEEESTMALELIRFIKKGNQLTLLLGEELASPRSNSSCPNTNDEELSIPEQTATGKGTSNPLMAGSLPKTTKPTYPCLMGFLGLISLKPHNPGFPQGCFLFSFLETSSGGVFAWRGFRPEWFEVELVQRGLGRSRPERFKSILSEGFSSISFGDMHIYVSQLKDAELKTLIATYDIPLDLRPRLPDSNFRMINLPAGDTAIGIYSKIFDSSGVRIPFSSFLLAVLKYFKVHISQLVPLGLSKVITFEVLYKVPTSFNQDHVDRLKAHIMKLRDILEGVLVWSGLSRVWCNPMCDRVLRCSDNTVMSIHDFLCMPSLEKATVLEEPHELGTSILGRVVDRTTPPAPAGTAIPRASLEEIEISTNTTKRTRLSQKVSGAGSSGLAAKDGVEKIDDGTLDDDGQRDGSEFAMEDIGNLNDVSQDKEVETCAELSWSARRTTRASSHASHGVSKDASSPAQEAVAAPDTQPLGTDAGADEIASDGNVDSYFDARVSNTAGDVLERDLLPFVPGPYYIPYPFDEGSGSESPP
ncbi:hypothetical protein Tco_1054676 [Tanacetum coccineum]|uniref:Uncharacterized protein n=1 Tax=Tanacetum coccineum TaxID=301880 RepID=A0ABQ5GXW5_9ASTR